MKKQKYKIKNANDGITLIALVITIIVMLILVAVTVTMAVNGGLFGHARTAARKTNNAIADEQALANGKINIAGERYDSPQEYVDTLTGKKPTKEPTKPDNCQTCQNAGRIKVWECRNDNCDASPVEPTEGYQLQFVCRKDDCGYSSRGVLS